MRKTALLLLPLIAATTLAGCSLGTQKPTEALPVSQPAESTPTPTPEKMPNDAGIYSYSLAEVAAHVTAGDCWLVINEKVYDVSPMIAGQKHPGGAAILEGCGKDATELFLDRPNGSGSHSAKAQALLPQYYLGDLTAE